MRDLLTKYETKKPEIVFEWKDSLTDAEGWVVINSLRGGAAGGGTRGQHLAACAQAAREGARGCANAASEGTRGRTE